MNRFIAIIFAGIALAAAPALGADDAPKAKSLNELLKQVKSGWRSERGELKQREEEFQRAKSSQAQKLAQARTTRQREEQRSEVMETRFENNEESITELEDDLRE